MGDDGVDAYGNILPRPGLHSSTSKQAENTEEDYLADTYNMKNKRRGIAVIFNNMNFEHHTGMYPRPGSERDSKNMYRLLCALGFEDIQSYDDSSVKKMKDVMDEVRNEDFSNKDCFLCVILSHGEEGYVYGTDDKVSIEDLVFPLKGNNCPSLALKPKIFFIQACRGKKVDDGVEVADAVGEDEEAMDESVEMRRIPTEADFIMAYSVVPGYFSWRNSVKGSWFMQAIYDVFMTKCKDGKHLWQKLDLVKLLTRVNKKVAFEFESNSSHMNMKKQIPCITSMLTKDLQF